MKHLGDITKINGAEIPAVDCITGGSPCQDLSVAGKRAGLDGERSGLFMEQIRIVKEMRAKEIANGRTGQFIRPRYMVWENVPGAFSSNGGKDFQAVLTEIVRIVEADAPDVPMPEKGKWTKAGCLYGKMGNWSIAWRVHDAQFWGVPQRRKRIALVADFGGLSAPEVLFERKGMSWDSEPCGTERKGTAEAVGNGVESASIGHWTIDEKMGNTYCHYECANTLGARDYKQPQATISFQERAGKPGGGKGILIQHEHVGALSTLNNQSVLQSANLYDAYQHHGWRESDTCGTLTVGQNNTVRGDTPLVASANGFGGYSMGAGTLRAAGGDHGGGSEMLAMNTSTVRRLTPLECERLQGFPDGWTLIGEPEEVDVNDYDCVYDDEGQVIYKRLIGTHKEIEYFYIDDNGKKKKCSDSNRYKALGNSIALPFWFYLLRRISALYERPATLGSLFDGIGGFPLCWERCNGQGTAIWASEIEEFPIAVTKRHFKEDT